MRIMNDRCNAEIRVRGPYGRWRGCSRHATLFCRTRGALVVVNGQVMSTSTRLVYCKRHKSHIGDPKGSGPIIESGVIA
jgi:hypothetical protein